MKTNNLIIEKSSYEGYIWHSDKAEAEVINGEFSLNIDSCENPFIVEAYLLDNITKTSHSIHFVDGSYIHTQTKVTDEDIANAVTYEGNKMKNLCFTQRWEIREDPFCCDMKTKVPGSKIFVGFEK